MKILLALLFLSLTFPTSNLFALTIQAEAKFNSLQQRFSKVQTSFGKLPSSGEFGIFLNITCSGTEGENDHESMFFRLPAGATREKDVLYTEVDGTRITLAHKKWYGWKLADNVTIHYSVENSRSRTFNVWVEVE